MIVFSALPTQAFVASRRGEFFSDRENELATAAKFPSYLGEAFSRGSQRHDLVKLPPFTVRQSCRFALIISGIFADSLRAFLFLQRQNQPMSGKQFTYHQPDRLRADAKFLADILGTDTVEPPGGYEAFFFLLFFRRRSDSARGRSGISSGKQAEHS